MYTLLLTGFLGVVLLSMIGLEKIYKQVPAKELKRRARAGDEMAALLYRATSYEVSLSVLLWLLLGLSAALFMFMVARYLPRPLALFGLLSVIWFGFAWLPNTRITWLGRLLARTITPFFAWLLSHLHSVLEKIGLLARKHARPGHNGIYQKDDLLEVLARQKDQADNRITLDELTMAENSLTFGDKLVRDIMVPRRMVKMIAAKDSVGPILMGELHESGFSRFPVYEGKQEKMVGILYLRDLLSIKTGGRVADAMRPEVYYVHEEQTLYQALQTFLRTKHHLFVVVNGFEEVTGIITIEDVIEQIIGKPIIDEFDQHDDLRAVAHKFAVAEHKKHEKLTPEATEVIE